MSEVIANLEVNTPLIAACIAVFSCLTALLADQFS